MKSLLLASLLLPLAFLAACTGPIAAQQQVDIRSTRGQVEVHSYWLATYLKAESPIVTRVGSGQLQVNVQVQNIGEQECNIDFQTTFYDKAGIQIEQTGWHNKVVDRKGTQQLEATSMSPLADDFHIEIRYLR